MVRSGRQKHHSLLPVFIISRSFFYSRKGVDLLMQDFARKDSRLENLFLALCNHSIFAMIFCLFVSICIYTFCIYMFYLYLSIHVYIYSTANRSSQHVAVFTTVFGFALGNFRTFWHRCPGALENA